jgi:protein gp37
MGYLQDVRIANVSVKEVAHDLIQIKMNDKYHGIVRKTGPQRYIGEVTNMETSKTVYVKQCRRRNVAVSDIAQTVFNIYISELPDNQKRL